MVNNSPANAGDTGNEGSIPGSGRGAYWATVHGIAKGQTQLSD